MAEVIELFNEFRTKAEKERFIQQQHNTILTLAAQKAQLEAEITHLKELLGSNTQLIESESSVSRVIVTPEEALIESQINILQNRSLGQELTLEDVKKLDLLLKNKNIIKSHDETIKADSKKVDKKSLSKAELIQIASSKQDE